VLGSSEQTINHAVIPWGGGETQEHRNMQQPEVLEEGPWPRGRSGCERGPSGSSARRALKIRAVSEENGAFQVLTEVCLGRAMMKMMKKMMMKGLSYSSVFLPC
jgi:hypothetical protein